MNSNSPEETKLTLNNFQKKVKLTKKQEMFCRYYASNGHNGAQAAISSGYSEKSAKFTSFHSLQKPHIIEFLNELEKPVIDKLELDEDWVITKLKNFADANINDFYDFDPQTNKILLKDLKLLPPEKTAAIETVKETKYGIEIKLVDKKTCVVSIGKHLGMFKEQLEGNINNNQTTKVYVVPAFNFDDDENIECIGSAD